MAEVYKLQKKHTTNMKKALANWRKTINQEMNARAATGDAKEYYYLTQIEALNASSLASDLVITDDHNYAISERIHNSEVSLRRNAYKNKKLVEETD